MWKPGIIFISGTSSKIVLKRGRRRKWNSKEIPMWGDDLKEKEEGNVRFLFRKLDGILVKV